MLRESLAADLIVELPNAVRLQRLVQTLREYFNSGAVGFRTSPIPRTSWSRAWTS